MFVRKLLLEFWGYGHAVFCKTSANYLVQTRTMNDFKILFQSDAIVRKAAFGREKYGKIMFVRKLLLEVWGYVFYKISTNYLVVKNLKLILNFYLS